MQMNLSYVKWAIIPVMLQYTLLYVYVTQMSVKSSCNLNAIRTDSTYDQPVTKEIKTILLWTTWYGRNRWFGFQDDTGYETFRTCPVANCRITRDRTLFNQSHAIFFHTQLHDFKFWDLPKFRLPHQRFVMYFFEPLMYSNRIIFNFVPSHFFNWTFTFRRFSDVASTQYGAYELIPGSMERKVTGNAQMEESLDDYYGVNITGKSIMVAWFNSHCNTSVLRENFAAELAKYVQVDIYGKCGKYKCRKKDNHENDDCDLLLAKKYLFYLSFENSFCPDYVTEKLFRPLRTAVVPIVFGGVHYSRFAPPHSYINALDYESPKQLADYLITLEKNRKLYAHYFEWRRHFRVPKVSYVDWCQLCAMLNDESLPSKSYQNISKWWFDDYPCQDYTWRMKS